MSETQKLKAAERPRVSVITPFLDGEAFLAEAIESVIAQSFPNWELLLVDDGSSPPATTIAKSYAAQYPGQIRYLGHPGHINRGISATRNLGIRHARGDFIAFVDADDVWLPSKLANHLAILDDHPEVGMVCGTAIYWNSWSNGRDNVLSTGHRQNIVVHPPEAALMLYPLGTANSPCTSSVVVRADLVKRIDGFDERFTGHYQLYEDQAFFLKVYLSAAVYFSSEPLLMYRLHPASCVATITKTGKYHQARLYFLEWLERFVMIPGRVDPRVTSSLRRALRPYRHPFIHYLLSVPAKVRNRWCRLSARVDRLICKHHS